MSAKSLNKLIRIIVAAALFIASYVTFYYVEVKWAIALIVNVAIYLIVAYDIIIKAVRGIFGGSVFDENFLMVIATVGAFCVREYPEAVAVMLFYQTGELLQHVAVGKSRKSIAELMDIRPDVATVIRGDEGITISPYEVEVGELIEVKPGERVALDGVIEAGESFLDTSALTGESAPVEVKEGSEVKSGSINLTSVIRIKTQKEFSQSTASKIIDLAENASSKKSKAESFITRFARIYTPVVVGLAALLAVIPSAITGDWLKWIHRALMFLVVSCPCAFVISVPLAFFGGIGAASHCGVLVKGGNYLELLPKINAIVTDKTGTVTAGAFSVTEVLPKSSRAEILRLAAIAESGSNHPIARSILTAAQNEGIGYDSSFSSRSEIAGKGIKAICGGTEIIAGNAEFIKECGIEFTLCDSYGTHVYVACNGKFEGVIVISDILKPDSASAIAQFKEQGVNCVMLTGDNSASAERVAKSVGIDEYYANLMPADKVCALESIMAKNKVTAFIGDGINDAPVLARADIGIAMGGIGSDSAIEAADVVLMHDSLTSVIKAKDIAKKTVSVSRQNIIFALIVKVTVLILSALGITNMWLAIFADVGVTLLAVLNSARVIVQTKREGINKKSGKKIIENR